MMEKEIEWLKNDIWKAIEDNIEYQWVGPAVEAVMDILKKKGLIHEDKD